MAIHMQVHAKMFYHLRHVTALIQHHDFQLTCMMNGADRFMQ
jgi:hypothetical protein